MPFPIATRTSAFIAGLSLSAPVTLLNILNARGPLDYGVHNAQVFAFFVGYFLLTVAVFVIDVRSFVPKQLKTRIPLVYFPTDQAGFEFLLTVLIRLLVWLLGAATGMIIIAVPILLLL